MQIIMSWVRKKTDYYREETMLRLKHCLFFNQVSFPI